jgi:hypothetical protein
VRKAEADTLVVADGTSCRHQIRDGAGRAALHVARVLAMSIEATRSRALNTGQSGKKMMPALPGALEMLAKNASINSLGQRIVTL